MDTNGLIIEMRMQPRSETVGVGCSIDPAHPTASLRPMECKVLEISTSLQTNHCVSVRQRAAAVSGQTRLRALTAPRNEPGEPDSGLTRKSGYEPSLEPIGP